MADEQHSVARGDAEQRDEADDCGYAHFARGKHQGEYSADECQRQVEQDDAALHGVLELHVEQEEDYDDAQQRRQQQGAACRLFALELAAVLHVVAFGQFHFGVNALAYVVHHAAQVAAARVGRNHDFALHVLAVDGVRAHGRSHFGHVGEWYFPPVGRVEHQVAYALHVAAVMLGGAHHEVEAAALLVDLRHRFAGHVRADEGVEVGQRYAVHLQHLALGLDFKLGPLHLLLHVEVGHALHVAHGVLYLVAQVEHLVKVVAEQLDGYAGLRAAQHGVYAVADGLAYFYVRALYGRQLVPYVVEKLLVRAVLQLERGLYFRHVHAQGVFVKLGTAGLSRHGLYFGD